MSTNMVDGCSSSCNEIIVHLLCPACIGLNYKKEVVHRNIHIQEHVNDLDISLYIINFVINFGEENFYYTCAYPYKYLGAWPC
jgi:hypothetical protein